MGRLPVLLLAATGLLLAQPQPKTLVYGRVGPSQIQLFVSNADGTAERPLLDSGSLDYNPTWSPDGQWIVFTSERHGSADLYRVKPDGTGLQRLTTNRAYEDQADLSPDGQKLAFVSTRADGTADLWIRDLGTNRETPLTSGRSGDFRPAWSPDGKWIAFSSDRGTNVQRDGGGQWWVHLQLADIYIMRPDGSALKKLTDSGNAGNFCGGPRWTRDSRHLVGYCLSGEETFAYRPQSELTDEALRRMGRAPVRGNTTLVSIDVATREQTTIAAPPGIKFYPAVLNDGEIAYVRKDGDDRGIAYRSTEKKGPLGLVRSPSWSPDGKRVVYHRLLSQNSPAWQKAWSRNPAYDLVTTNAMPAFDPSGKRLIATADNTRLVQIEPGRNAADTLFQQEGKLTQSADWSPQGDAILFGLGQYFRNRARGAQVAMIKPDGSGLREVTSGANNNGFPSYAPDGKRFVYRTFGPEGQGLRIMNLEDGRVATLTEDYDNFPRWSPRGDVIIFVRRLKGSFVIFSIAPDGRRLKRLTGPGSDDSHAAWSPDGEWIAFSSARMGFKDEALNTDSPQPYGEIFVMRYDGTHVEQLTDNQWEEGSPAWLPSNRTTPR
jgi:Tol biopolymer transport system component